MDFILKYNEITFRFLNDLAGQSLLIDIFFIFSAQFLIFFLIGGVIIFFSRRRDNVFEKIVVIGASVFIAWIISQGINALFPVMRPYLVLDNVYSLFEHGSNDSFPSGHATVGFALAFSLFFYEKHLAWFVFLGALVVGISRVVAGVHSPVDIVGAYILACIVAIVVKYGYLRLKRFADLHR